MIQFNANDLNSAVVGAVVIVAVAVMMTRTVQLVYPTFVPSFCHVKNFTKCHVPIVM